MKDLYRIVPYDFETEDESVFVGRREMLVKVVPDYEAMVYEAKEHLWRHLTVDEAKALWKAALQETKMMTGVYPKEIGNDTVELHQEATDE